MVTFAKPPIAPHLDLSQVTAEWLLRRGFKESGYGYGMYWREITRPDGKPVTWWMVPSGLAVKDAVAFFEFVTQTKWKES